MQMHTRYFVSSLMSLFVLASFFVFSSILGEVLILYFGIPFAFVTFLFVYTLLHEQGISFDINLPQLMKILPLLLTILAISFVLLVPSKEVSILEWTKIPMLNWLRYLSTLLLTSLLPGYFFLKTVVDKKGLLRGSLTVVLSYLLSIFITFIIGFLILLHGNTISSLTIYIVIIVNLGLMIGYYYVNKTKARVSNGNKFILNVKWPQDILLFSILAAVILGITVIALYNLPLTPWDMWSQLGLGLQYAKGFPSYGGLLAPAYPYLFPIYIAVIFPISGIPPALSLQGLYVFSFMPVLAFYSLFEEWFHEKEDKLIPITSTFFSILLGFGSLYALYIGFTQPNLTVNAILDSTISNTYDIFMRNLYLPDYVAPLWNVGLPSFLVLLGLVRIKSQPSVSYVLIPVLVAVGYLAHIGEVSVFVILAFLYSILFYRDYSGKKLGVSIFLGLILVAAVDLSAPAQQYLFTTAGSFSLEYALSLIVSIAMIAFDYARQTKFVSLTNLKLPSFSKLKAIWPYCKWILLYAYLFSFVAWFSLLTTGDLGRFVLFSFTPFFFFPIRIGLVGILALILILAYSREIAKDKRLLFFAGLMALGFILEQANNYVISLYPSYRFGTFTFIGACILSGWGLLKLLKNISAYSKQQKKWRLSLRNSKKILIVCLLVVVAIPGMVGSSLFYVYSAYTSNRYYDSYGVLTQSELDALHFVNQHLLNNESVLTFAEESSTRLESFGGVRPVQDANRWSDLLLSTSNPNIITYILSSSNIKYIYVAQRDVELLNSSALNSFVKYFPEVFENDYVTIYEVPDLTAPSSSQASFGVLDFSPSLQSPENTTWIDDSFTEGWYPYRQYGEVKNYESEVNNGIMNMSVTSNQSGNIWASYAHSGLSLNTTICSTLSFTYRVENNFTWFTFQLWNSTNQVFLYEGHLTASDFATESLVLPENQTVTRIELAIETVKDAPAGTTARADIDYIEFSAPTYTWSDDTFLKDWAFYKTYGNVSGMSAFSDGDILKINVTSNQSGDVWASYSLPLALETKDSVLSFRYKVDNDYTWFTIILQNTTARYFFYEGHLTDKAWTTKSYSLPDGQDITRVEIIVETTDNAPPQTTAVAEIESIGISQQTFSQDDVLPSLFASLLHTNYTVLYVDSVLMQKIDTYLPDYTNILLTSDPPIPVESLLNWVSAGNTLTVINSRGNGFLADLFGINSSSPLLSINNINSGRVLYINSFPTVTAVMESEILQPEFLKQVRELLNIEEYTLSVEVLPVYNSISGGMTIQGDVNIDTDILMLQGTINLTSSPFSINESKTTTMYGKINLTIKNATLAVSPSESYMLIKPEGFPIEGEVLVSSSEETLIVADANVIYNSDMPVSFKFNATAALSLYVRLPSINASGTTSFDQLDVESSLYVPLAGIVQQPAEIQGSVRFDTMYISNPITIFSMFHAEGKTINLAETTALRPTIPWTEVLTSLYNIAFNAAFFLCIAIYIVKKRTAKTETADAQENTAYYGTR